MLRHARVEAVRRDLILAREELELFFGHDEVQKTLLRAHLLQLHSVTFAESPVTRKRTRPQWQPPSYVCMSGR